MIQFTNLLPAGLAHYQDSMGSGAVQRTVIGSKIGGRSCPQQGAVGPVNRQVGIFQDGCASGDPYLESLARRPAEGETL